MVGRFGGAAFVLLYLIFALVIGLPALMAEWTLGRHTRRGTVGAFERAGLPGGKALGWLLFFTVSAATAYYSNAIGWVVFHGLSEAARPLGLPLSGAAILPPEAGFNRSSFLIQLGCTALVVFGAVTVLLRGLRAGIERASTILTPLLFFSLLVIIVRSLTLPGAEAGLEWYILKFQLTDITPTVALAALGQVIFSLALGGTFMVVYGSYMNEEDHLGRNALWTVGGDTCAGLLAGLAIFPAVLALGLEPSSGPGLIFVTLPRVFAEIPAGWVFGALFFLALAGAAFLSAVAAFEVLIAGITDNVQTSRRRATWSVAALVFLLALPPMINMRIFIPWDLTFGSGAQTAGVLVAVLAVGWGMKRAAALKELGEEEEHTVAGPRTKLLYLWIRWVIPSAVLAVGIWWILSEALAIVTVS
jgi:NSS family neurotransmitter:Na+ symporter